MIRMLELMGSCRVSSRKTACVYTIRKAYLCLLENRKGEIFQAAQTKIHVEFLFAQRAFEIAQLFIRGFLVRRSLPAAICVRP